MLVLEPAVVPWTLSLFEVQFMILGIVPGLEIRVINLRKN